jgi:tetratricopeptide (TPR) repeat protein
MFRPVLILAAFSAVASSPAVATTIQQDFDAAQALIDAGEYPRARAAFTALLARFPIASAGRASSLVRARLGNMMLATGDPEAAEPLLTAAIAGFKGATPQDADERATAGYDLGRAQEARGALDTAGRTYLTVLASKAFPADGLAEIGLRASLARTLIWSDPAEARRLLDGLLALPPEKLGSAREQRALLETLRGRVELNNNNPAEARRWFTMAARSAGGAETRKISVADIRIRGDLALANQMLGRLDEVQKYVAYSGAGTLVNEGLTAAAAMPLPACAPLTGLATDAVAVVEFAIGADGRVSGVTPIYASRGSGESAAAAQDDGPEILFPTAVSRWFWNTEEVANLDPFWRRAVRVELRCFNSRPDEDPVRSAFRGETIAWLQGLGVRDDPDWPDNDAAALPLVRAELARREQTDGPQSAQLLPVLVALISNNAAPNAERRAAATRWQALTAQYKPPMPVRTDFRLTEIMWESGPIRSQSASLQFKRDKMAELIWELQATGDGDSRAAMLVRLRLGETLEEMRDSAVARALFATIVAGPESVLPAGDPIRTAALLRVSNIAAAARDTATAASAFAATGLTAEQCSLIDVRPQGINNRISEKDFPSQSIRWGTGGFTRIAYDITADGNTANVRTIFASPPFIFGPGTEKAISQFKFRPVFRPGNTIGCTGNAQYVRFMVAQ